MPFNKELRKVILFSKWGDQQNDQLIWLSEGLSAYVTPEVYNCDMLSLEEKYVYLMQKEKLINLMQFPPKEAIVDYKIAQTQSAYIIKNLLNKYGIENIKRLWNEGMSSFAKIYESDFNTIILEMDKQLNNILAHH